MSSESSYVKEYHRFQRNRFSNNGDSSHQKPLHSSDLRNKINKKYSEGRETEWQRRREENNERRDNYQMEWRKISNNEDNKIFEVSSDSSLYKEYVQWDFINNNLYRKGMRMLGITGRGIQEFTNTLQRWFIFINEDFNDVPKLQYYPILPNICLSHPAAKFLRSALIEKGFVDFEDADEATTKLLSYIVSSHGQVVPHEQAGPLDIEYNETRHLVTVREFQSPEVPRVSLLVEKGGLVATGCMLLRYESFGNGSYQWGDPREVHRVLHDKFQVRYEGFASPVNSRFIEYDNTYFCSLFPETDAVFGSLGNFFHVDMRLHSGGWSVNPPFLNDLMKQVADRIVAVLDAGDPCYFFCTFPWWDDDDGWITLNTSRHLLKRFDLKAQHFIVQDAYGNQFYPNMAMNLFVLGELPQGSTRLTELGNILIHNSVESMPDQCPW